MSKVCVGFSPSLPQSGHRTYRSRNESGTFTNAIPSLRAAAGPNIELAVDHAGAYVVSSARLPASDTSRLDLEAGLIGEELPLLNERKSRLQRRPARSQLLRACRVSDVSDFRRKARSHCT
jgi:hypothetical protein